jgi:hypothetical protein
VVGILFVKRLGATADLPVAGFPIAAAQPSPVILSRLARRELMVLRWVQRPHPAVDRLEPSFSKQNSPIIQIEIAKPASKQWWALFGSGPAGGL